MKITAKNIGKRYGKNWVFRGLEINVQNGAKVAITGKNGAGKSTLLQILGGYLTPSEGFVQHNDQNIDIDRFAGTYIGPYTEIIEEMALREFLHFHANFKKATLELAEMARRASLPLDKFIADFSTGMKQRVKLITAFYFENEMILMDEPTSNLDHEGFEWWQEELQELERTVLIASNDPHEIELSEKTIKL